ncbi:MarR family transcriptional regulator [Anaerocolumna cellulosilytica]|uniref:MarR family transcriptional regulator n=1 Tax=Anaerocolumna cellulosilytica TaxID=433286 RepID=A0A6S6R8V5_9FIRM|nr:MarR family transcriptional regulator [Anaerocolumna cellulosilytica]MBB5197522.1 DNA-binding MarR family transcriptional regulator [Anaerocolumna cellulosilytica]BCJ96547.1 MarR family transcriptional regulator [Anaerocolumna cellulosilytica]
MKIPENKQYVLFGGAFVLANKLQLVADKKTHGLSTKQWFLLRNLSDLPADPPPTITMLAKETDTSRQNVSKMLEVLQRQGYVALQNNAEDHRSQSVVLTESGAQVLRQVAQEAVPFFTKLFSGISEEECAVSADVVIKLIDNLCKMQEEME